MCIRDSSYTVHLKDLDMANTIFDLPDLSAFTRLDDLGLEVTGQRIEADHAVLAYRITGEDRWCRRAGHQELSLIHICDRSCLAGRDDAPHRERHLRA